MIFNDLLQELEEYDSLPDDLTTRINFDPPPVMPIICSECGLQFSTFPISWTEISIAIKKRGKGNDKYMLKGLCAMHLDSEEEEQE